MWHGLAVENLDGDGMIPDQWRCAERKAMPSRFSRPTRFSHGALPRQANTSVGPSEFAHFQFKSSVGPPLRLSTHSTTVAHADIVGATTGRWTATQARWGGLSTWCKRHTACWGPSTRQPLYVHLKEQVWGLWRQRASRYFLDNRHTCSRPSSLIRVKSASGIQTAREPILRRALPRVVPRRDVVDPERGARSVSRTSWSTIKVPHPPPPPQSRLLDTANTYRRVPTCKLLKRWRGQPSFTVKPWNVVVECVAAVSPPNVHKMEDPFPKPLCPRSPRARLLAHCALPTSTCIVSSFFPCFPSCF